MNYKEKRKKLKLTQMEVALKLGISLVAWQLIERGITKTPRRETQERIDLLFGICPNGHIMIQNRH